MGAEFRPWDASVSGEKQSGRGIYSFGIFWGERIEIAAHRGRPKTGALPDCVASNLMCSHWAHVFLSVRGIGRGAHWPSCRGESTDAERGIEAGAFLKSVSGKALTVREEKIKSCSASTEGCGA